MATPDKRYYCSDLVPGDVNTCQQFTNHCGNKGSVIHLCLLTLLHFDRTILCLGYVGNTKLLSLIGLELFFP